MAGPRWTADELTRLTELAGDGYYRREAAAVLGRSPVAVKHKKRELGLKFKAGSRGAWWVPGAVLWALRNGAYNSRTVGAKLGRSRAMAHRWLEDLRRRHVVARKGKARRTRYVPTNLSGGIMSVVIPLQLDQAKFMVLCGAKFGDVYPILAPADRVALREWFVHESGVPARPPSPTDLLVAARDMGYTGDDCKTCGSMKMIRDGKCFKCLDCGSTDGGCS